MGEQTSDTATRTKSEFTGGVFISYRRSLSRSVAERLHALLLRHFPARRVFIDKSAIPVASTFPAEISAALERAHVILIIISPGWADCMTERAALIEVDWVRHEVATALARHGSETPPVVIPVLASSAAMPSATDLPESLAPLSAINALNWPGDEWTDRDPAFRQLLDMLTAAIPQETSPVDLDDLARICCEDVLLRLSDWTSIRELDALHKRWEQDFNPPTSCKPHEALNALRSKIEDGRKARRLSREGINAERAEILKEECVAIVAELLRLGACRLASSPDLLGDHHRPARLQALAIQLFAVAYGQRQRRATIRFEVGSMADIGRIPVERAVDQRTVSAGILQDQSSDILDQLWELVPEFRGKTRTYNRHTQKPEELADLAAALRAMNAEDKSRIAIALEGSCTTTTGATVLREWLARMHLDVDVLVRTGVSHTDIADQEKDLILATWRCLQQIEGIGGERPR